MKLIATCSNCQNDILVKPTEHSRYDLSREKRGDEFSVICKECGRNTKIHVNDVIATESQKTLFVFMAIIIFLSVLAYIFFRNNGVLVFTTIPFLVIGYMYNAEHENVRTFNKFRL